MYLGDLPFSTDSRVRFALHGRVNEPLCCCWKGAKREVGPRLLGRLETQGKQIVSLKTELVQIRITEMISFYLFAIVLKPRMARCTSAMDAITWKAGAGDARVLLKPVCSYRCKYSIIAGGFRYRRWYNRAWLFSGIMGSVVEDGLHVRSRCQMPSRPLYRKYQLKRRAQGTDSSTDSADSRQKLVSLLTDCRQLNGNAWSTADKGKGRPPLSRAAPVWTRRQAPRGLLTGMTV